MSASVVEVLTPAVIASNASGSISISTTLVTNDLVVVLMACTQAGGNTVTINGSAPTAVGDWQNGSFGERVYAYVKTGLTGSHAVSYTTGITTFSNEFTVLVVRGLTTPSSTAFQVSGWSGTSVGPSTDVGPASQTVGTDQVAVFAAVATAGTLTFPSNPTPSGWTTDRADGSGTSAQHNVAHRVITASGTAQANVQSSSSAAFGTLMLILGDAGAGAPPLSSSFVGWGNPIF